MTIAGHMKVELRSVSKVFVEADAGRVTAALQNVDLQIRVGEIVSLVGPSGCGKTTALNLIAGFDMATSGEVLLEGQPITGPGADRGVVFQEPTLFHWLTVEENIAFGPRMQGKRAEEYLPL